MAKKYYTEGPQVPAAKVTTGKLTQTASLGNDMPDIVPSAPGKTSGLAGAAHSFPKSPRGGHGFGHDAINRLGKIRLSGNGGAHRIGKRG